MEDYFSTSDLNRSAASLFSPMKRDYFRGPADFY